MKKSLPRKAKAGRSPSVGRSLLARGPPQKSEDFAVVGIGASAGGLEACRNLVGALPAKTGMAFILVQHLDPTHESMMVDLLAGHTKMTVVQATDGMAPEVDHLYIIPPGSYLSVDKGALRLSEPRARHGARLPFDFLLHSLAEEYGPRAICVVLSGTGADGSLGLKAIREKGGLVIAQDPAEAGFDGMPRSAMLTGAVDQVLAVADIAKALIAFGRRKARAPDRGDARNAESLKDWLPKIIDLLRAKTAHDFALYKQGTLQRRIERRMAMAAIDPDDRDRYLALLRTDAGERDLLAKDLLINVTSFFRDPQVFEFLSGKILPDLIAKHSPDNPLRIWVPGCSTGEETYSLAMLFREHMEASKPNLKLQIFASDVDAEAVFAAREGLYPESIEADVSPARLARFFTKEEHGYRVSPELRETVVFTVQDVLGDPPFSRLDLISYRNLLIYLLPEAQTKIVSLFHFALREGGILLLGSSETVGDPVGRFDVISKQERLYRRVGHGRPGEFGFTLNTGDGPRVIARTSAGHPPSRQAAYAELCQRLVTETYAPATVLVNRKYECLYSTGPTDRYLRVAPGQPTHDLLAMARQDMRTKLRSAIQQAIQTNASTTITGGRTNHNGNLLSFSIAVQPVVSEGEPLLLICFVEQPKQGRGQSRPGSPADMPRIAEIEQELDATRTELQGAIRNLELSNEEQRAMHEEALSVSEEYQSTNEELLTSKEELQSLNEELTALNTQLNETLDRQRTTSNDLQNVLYSTDVATIFLDTKLNIRFFTPATKLLFNVIPSDIGRPLADLSSLASDLALLADARAVLENFTPIEREIEARTGAWYVRRVLPYRADDNVVEGVVITFADITERRHSAEALETTERKAQLANVAKSRFLAAASHDLRQPLQTLVLLQGLLARAVVTDKAKNLVARLDDTLSTMAGMLNTLLDINQIEAGTVRPEIVDFPIGELLERLRDEFTMHAQVQKLAMRVVPSSLTLHSDPRLLEQMIRNLISNALKYTKRGKVLVGCRRRGRTLSIEVWDSGVGIPDEELEAIFEEYHQIDNVARERSLGLGLGLSIVRRLGKLLGHRVNVHSTPGKGSVFAIEVELPQSARTPRPEPARHPVADTTAEGGHGAGTILVVDDDPDVRELLQLLLEGEGYHVTVAADGIAALELVARAKVRPDLILADYNLPHGMDGLQLTAKLRELLRRPVPVVILTGDISTETLSAIAAQDCVQLNKPVKPKEMTQVIQRLLATAPAAPPAPAAPAANAASGDEPPTIFIVDDDDQVRAALRAVLEEDGRIVEDFSACDLFLAAYRPGREGCLLIDAYLPGMSGLELLQRLRGQGDELPAIMITGHSDVHMAVQAMKSGASDFIEKPVGRDDLLAGIALALERSKDATKLSAWHEDAAKHVASLTAREREVMEMVLAGHPSKNIAADLHISQRTVENHRASIMKKTGSKSMPALARLALAASGGGKDSPPPGVSPGRRQQAASE
jgi:two-component system CheB/CheR fusion protein